MCLQYNFGVIFYKRIREEICILKGLPYDFCVCCIYLDIYVLWWLYHSCENQTTLRYFIIKGKKNFYVLLKIRNLFIALKVFMFIFKIELNYNMSSSGWGMLICTFDKQNFNFFSVEREIRGVQTWKGGRYDNLLLSS